MARTRIDVAALYSALDRARQARNNMSWRALAKELDVAPSTFSRLSNGHPPSATAFAAMASWLGTSTEQFIISDLAEAPDEPDLLSQLAPLLRARRDLTSQDVEHIEDLIAAAIKRFNSERSGV
jgi:transcriptional regulator with XRE-family HTH domain